MIDEGLLQGVKRAIAGKAFHRGNAASLVLDRKCETGIDPLTVHKDGAGATGTLVTSLLRPRETQLVPKQIQERRSDIRIDLGCLSVDDEMHSIVSSDEPDVVFAVNARTARALAISIDVSRLIQVAAATWRQAAN
jgi:hypothetical protein